MNPPNMHIQADKIKLQLQKGNTKWLQTAKSKITGYFKKEAKPWTCCQQKKYTVVYLLIAIFLLLVALESMTPFMPKRHFPDTARPDRCNNCFPYNYKNKIEPQGLCKEKEKIDLVLLITTIPRERLAREVIRSTWCNFTAIGVSTVRCVFLFGIGYSRDTQAALELEARTHNDILQEDFFDSYYNLSIKVLMGYRWLMRRCTQAKYVIRTAEDNYVHVPQVLELLRAKGSQLDSLMFGHCKSYGIVWRWPFHRWVVSFKEYPNIAYPPYCVGTTFVTSYKLMTEIVKISVHVPFFPIEDVYFGMCVQQYNNKYKLAAVEGFSTPLFTWSDVFFGSHAACSFPRPWYSMHDVSPSDIWRVWNECKGSQVEKVKRLSHDDEEDFRLNNIYEVGF